MKFRRYLILNFIIVSFSVVPFANAQTPVVKTWNYLSDISTITVSPTNVDFLVPFQRIRVFRIDDDYIQGFPLATNGMALAQTFTVSTNILTSTLLPNEEYLILHHTSSIVGAVTNDFLTNVANPAYPINSFSIGFVYIETNSSSEIECFSFLTGTNSTPNGNIQNFLSCEQNFDQDDLQEISFNFLGSTTPLDIVGYVSDGVAETGSNTIPIAGSIIGVPLAFVIGRGLLILIRSGV